MKIRFSVFLEDYDKETAKLVDSLWIETAWGIRDIDEHIALYNGFRSEVLIGEHLSFFNIFCYFADCNELLQKIQLIPKNNSAEKTIREPCIFRVKEFNPGNADEPKYPANKHCYLYALERYEYGANSYDALLYWASTHPLEMMFIGGVIYDISKWIVLRVLRFFGRKKSIYAKCPIVLNTRKLYSNFSKITNIEIKECQITKIKRLKLGDFNVKICTSSGKEFLLRCYANGAIINLDENTPKFRKA